MNISLSQKEITAAVRAYVASRGIAAGFVLSDVKFSMTRNPAAISAELSLDEVETDSTVGTTGSGEKTSGNTVASLIANTAKEVVQTTAAAEEVTIAVPAEEVKSVPEETAAAVDTGAVEEPAPAGETAAVNTTSLFG